MARPTTIKLYSYRGIPMVQPVEICLCEKQVAYETVETSPYEKPDWFVAISPTGQGLMPVLEVDGEYLFESAAINEYLDEVCDAPKLLPSDPLLRAKNRAWAAHAFEVLMAMGGMMAVRRAEEFQGARAGLIGKLQKISEQLGDGPYWNGEAFSLIDIQYAPILQRVDILDRIYGTDVLSCSDKVRRWAAAVIERPSIQATTPPPVRGKAFDDTFYAAFMDTYLTSQKAAGLSLARRL